MTWDGQSGARRSHWSSAWGWGARGGYRGHTFSLLGGEGLMGRTTRRRADGSFEGLMKRRDTSFEGNPCAAWTAGAFDGRDVWVNGPCCRPRGRSLLCGSRACWWCDLREDGQTGIRICTSKTYSIFDRRLCTCARSGSFSNLGTAPDSWCLVLVRRSRRRAPDATRPSLSLLPPLWGADHCVFSCRSNQT